MLPIRARHLPGVFGAGLALLLLAALLALSGPAQAKGIQPTLSIMGDWAADAQVGESGGGGVSHIRLGAKISGGGILLFCGALPVHVE